MSEPIATVAAGSGPAAKPAPSPFMSFVPLIFMFGVLYFLIIRPQQKQARKQREMLNAVKRGDRVLTRGGLIGTVTALKGSIVEMKIADDVRVEVEKSAVSVVLSDQAYQASVTPTMEKPA